MVTDWATSHGLDLHLELDQPGGRRVAIEEALRRAIRQGTLAPDTRLPSTRGLAADLGVARGTVAEAYDQLVAEGWLVARRGAGTHVGWEGVGPARGGHTQDRTPEADAAERQQHDFQPGTPDVSAFPRNEWVAALRRALRTAPDAVLRYGDPRGPRPVREVLAGYLARARGVRGDADHLLVCSGFVQALAVMVSALDQLGAGAIAMEDPCMASYRSVTARGGLAVQALPVDDQGADPAALQDGAGLLAALLTPAHQYPFGATLAPARRAAFTSWARQVGGYVIEDDYDGEFRYDRQPVGALQGIDPERVVYAGTASKSLAPALRLGWLVVPPALLDPVVAAKELADRHTGVLDQLALAELIAGRGLDRHIRRSRLRYRRRRDALLGALATVPAVRVRGIAAGLHALVELPEAGPDEHEVVAALARQRVGVQGLGPYWHRPEGHRPGLVVGFGTPAEHAFPASLAALTSALGTIYRGALRGS